jgi:hypothetical protein
MALNLGALKQCCIATRPFIQQISCVSGAAFTVQMCSSVSTVDNCDYKTMGHCLLFIDILVPGDDGVQVLLWHDCLTHTQ